VSIQQQAPSTTLKVGVVGIGWAGQQHLKAYSNIDGVEIVAVAGMEADLLAQLKEEYSIPHAFARWEDMIELEGLDAVSVAVPTFLHAPIAIAALERGLHVLSEKPLARNAVEGQQMVDAARKAGRVLDVAFNHRRRGDIQALKEVIDDGTLGRPYYAKASWLRRQGIPMLGSWFTNPELAGGGPLADIGVHVLDYSLHLLGEPKVLAVSASTHSELGPRGLGGNARYTASNSSHKFEVEDFASAFIRLEGGGTLILEAGWATYRDERGPDGLHRLRDRRRSGLALGRRLREPGGGRPRLHGEGRRERRLRSGGRTRASPPGRRRRFHCRRPRWRDRVGKPRRFPCPQPCPGARCLLQIRPRTT
jgi:predicted dehydrogenase